MGKQNEGVDPEAESTGTLTIRLNGNVKRCLSIIGAIIAIFISLYPYVNSYFRTKAMIEAHQNEICDIKKTVDMINSRVTFNEKEILKLTQQSEYTNKAISEIKDDLKEIKKLLSNR